MVNGSLLVTGLWIKFTDATVTLLFVAFEEELLRPASDPMINPIEISRVLDFLGGFEFVAQVYDCFT